MSKDTFDVLILIGRPASGKSEISDHLMQLTPEVRRSKFHIADLGVIVIRGSKEDVELVMRLIDEIDTKIVVRANSAIVQLKL